MGDARAHYEGDGHAAGKLVCSGAAAGRYGIVGECAAGQGRAEISQRQRLVHPCRLCLDDIAVTAEVAKGQSQDTADNGQRFGGPARYAGA